MLRLTKFHPCVASSLHYLPPDKRETAKEELAGIAGVVETRMDYCKLQIWYGEDHTNTTSAGVISDELLSEDVYDLEVNSTVYLNSLVQWDRLSSRVDNIGKSKRDDWLSVAFPNVVELECCDEDGKEKVVRGLKPFHVYEGMSTIKNSTIFTCTSTGITRNDIKNSF